MEEKGLVKLLSTALKKKHEQARYTEELVGLLRVSGNQWAWKRGNFSSVDYCHQIMNFLKNIKKNRWENMYCNIRFGYFYIHNNQWIRIGQCTDQKLLQPK